MHASSGDRSIPDGDKIGESTPSFVLGLAFSPSGGALASVSSSRSLRLHDLTDGSSRLLLSARSIWLLSPSALMAAGSRQVAIKVS